MSGISHHQITAVPLQTSFRNLIRTLDQIFANEIQTACAVLRSEGERVAQDMAEDGKDIPSDQITMQVAQLNAAMGKVRQAVPKLRAKLGAIGATFKPALSNL